MKDTTQILLAHIQERQENFRHAIEVGAGVPGEIRARLQELDLMENVLDAANRLQGLASGPTLMPDSGAKQAWSTTDPTPPQLKHSMDDGTQTEYVPESEESST